MTLLTLLTSMHHEDRIKPLSVKRTNPDLHFTSIVKRSDTGNTNDSARLLLKGYKDFIVTNYHDNGSEISITLLKEDN